MKAWPGRSAQCRPPSPPPPASPPASKATPRRADRRPSPFAGSPASPQNATGRQSSPSPPQPPRPLPSSNHPPPESEDHDRFSSSLVCHAKFQSIALRRGRPVLRLTRAGHKNARLGHILHAAEGVSKSRGARLRDLGGGGLGWDD